MQELFCRGLRSMKVSIFPGWPARSHLNIPEPLWSVLETGVRNRFTHPTYLKQLEYALPDEWYNIRRERESTQKQGTKLEIITWTLYLNTTYS
jgi:hypothetical protein